MKVYTMTASVYQRLKAKGYKLVCRRCGKPIKIGDLVVTSGRQRSKRMKQYHYNCYEEMFIETAEDRRRYKTMQKMA